jgi:hypothetical protein
MTTTSADVGTIQYPELAAALRGDLIVPGDPGYDEARAVYNGMIDKYLAAIARLSTTRTTSSISTRTSWPPASPAHRPGRPDLKLQPLARPAAQTRPARPR